jgi:3-deoxy-manno-octulosonate cytidylyltransferase (CMP-KDO synthetase)
MENNILIDVILANSSPIGVDTHEDYMEIKKLMEYKN